MAKGFSLLACPAPPDILDAAAPIGSARAMRRRACISPRLRS